MGDSIPNFSDMGDLGDTSYTGLSDTGFDFTGSSTMQDVQLGAPIPLDTSYGVTGSSVTDMLDPNYNWLNDPTLGTVPMSVPSQSLTGASDTPPAAASAVNSTPTPNVAQTNQQTSQALTALSKFGASFASLMGGQPVVRTSNVAPQFVTQAGAPLPTVASGTSTAIVLIVVGALIFLLLRSGEE